MRRVQPEVARIGAMTDEVHLMRADDGAARDVLEQHEAGHEPMQRDLRDAIAPGCCGQRRSGRRAQGAWP